MFFRSKEAYYNSLVRICLSVDDNRPAGTGVLVAEDTILTCAHVVDDALRGQAGAANDDLAEAPSVFVHRPFVDGKDGTESELVACRIEQYFSRTGTDEARDLAVLKTREAGRYPIDGSLGISCFSSKTPQENDRIRVFGFPPDVSELIGQTVEAAYHIDGTKPNGWLSALADKGYGDEIRPGFSGAPVMRHCDGDLIGIVCEADADEKRRTATIIPVSLIQEVTPLRIRSREETTQLLSEEKEAPVALNATNSLRRLLLDWLWPSLHYFLTVRVGLLSDSPERAVLEQRLREQQADWSQELQDKTFLPPPAKEVPVAPPQFLLTKKKFYTPIQQLIKEIAGLSSGGDAASAQIAALSKKSRRVRSLVKRLRRTEVPLIVLGDPGSGKTITLKQVAIELSTVNSGKVFPALCLFIPLGRWKPVDRPSIRDIEALVAETAGPKLAPLLAGLARQRRLTVVFDGLDEMSRQKYTEHTEALSKYADRYTGQIKTLFSCRIADFSPAFKHSRLVLLPFSQRHIIQYLTRQFGREKQTVSGELLSIKELGKRLAMEKLPIQPRNPFSLWLLALYVRENQCWPETRTALLAFYFEYQYKRKLKEAASAGPIFPEKEQIFKDWGRLALFITRQNQGTDIGIHEVRALFGQRTDSLVEAGRTCGVLQRTLDHDPPLIRFDHHRAQEYFTACGIVGSNAEIDWNQLLDLPRWQETLVNVAQMDAQAAPLSVLADSLKAIGCDSEDADPVSRVLQESQDAERVELSTRVLTAVPQSEEADALEQEVSKSVNWLVDKGNPTSQVKMLRLVDRLPDQDARDVVEKTMESKISWVRDQALEVAASISESVSASPLPIEVANAYGDGSILRLIGSRLRIAKKVKSKGLAVVSVISFVLFLLHMFVVAAIVQGVSSYIVRKVACNDYFYSNVSAIEQQVEKRELSEQDGRVKIIKMEGIQHQFEDWTPLLVLAVIVLSVIASVIWLPAYHWMSVPAAGFGIVSIPCLIYFLWCYLPSATLENIFNGFPILFTGAFLIGSASFVWWLLEIFLCVFLGAMLVVSIFIWLGKDIYLTKFSVEPFFGAVGNEHYVMVAVIGGWYSFLYSIIWLLVKGYSWITDYDRWWISPEYRWVKLILSIDREVPDLPYLNRFFDYALSGFIFFEIIITCWVFVNFVKRGKYKVVLSKSFFKSNKKKALYGVIYLIVVFFFEFIIHLAVTSPDYSVSWLLKVVIFLLVIAMLVLPFIALGWMTPRAWKKYAARRDSRLRQISKKQFEVEIASKDIDRQTQFLRCTDPGRLSLTTEDYFKLLIEMEPHITEEPALSQYYQKRIELEEILRHERHG
jgi:V8-like Glu-specific endopeptidase